MSCKATAWPARASASQDPQLRKGRPLNELEAATESNLSAIMGRMSAYTGKRVTWEQALNSKEDLSPKQYAPGPNPVPDAAIPGKTKFI